LARQPRWRGLKTLEHAVSRLEELEVPWAFCWGNHDLLDDYQAGHDRIQAPAIRFTGALPPTAITGLMFEPGQWRFQDLGAALVAEQQPIRAHRVAARLAASRQKGCRRYRCAPVPSLGFYHIPLLEQKTLYRPNVTPGTFLEEVCHEQESGQPRRCWRLTIGCWPVSAGTTTSTITRFGPGSWIWSTGVPPAMPGMVARNCAKARS
jgi:hypothetical protein